MNCTAEKMNGAQNRLKMVGQGNANNIFICIVRGYSRPPPLQRMYKLNMAKRYVSGTRLGPPSSSEKGQDEGHLARESPRNSALCIHACWSSSSLPCCFILRRIVSKVVSRLSHEMCHPLVVLILFFSAIDTIVSHSIVTWMANDKTALSTMTNCCQWYVYTEHEMRTISCILISRDHLDFRFWTNKNTNRHKNCCARGSFWKKKPGARIPKEIGQRGPSNTILSEDPRNESLARILKYNP